MNIKAGSYSGLLWARCGFFVAGLRSYRRSHVGLLDSRACCLPGPGDVFGPALLSCAVPGPGEADAASGAVLNGEAVPRAVAAQPDGGSLRRPVRSASRGIEGRLTLPPAGSALIGAGTLPVWNRPRCLTAAIS